jgi:hypothetical protein
MEDQIVGDGERYKKVSLLFATWVRVDTIGTRSL